MFAQNQNIDKVNMSLDDIIKLNKKQNQSKNNKIGAKNKAKIDKNNKFNVKNKVEIFSPKKEIGFGQQRRRRFNQNFQNQPGPSKKSYGIQDRSKSIQKKKLIQKKTANLKNNKQNNNNVKPNQFTRRQPQRAKFIANRRHIPNNNNRAKRFIENPRQGVNKTTNNKPAVASTVQIIKPSGSTNPNINKKPQVKLQLYKKKKENLTSKITMQTARKNVQKAKRLLIAKKKPVKQLMTQKYAIKLGVLRKTDSDKKNLHQDKLKQQKILQQPKKQTIKDSKPKMVKVNIANRVNKIRLRKAKQQQVFRKKIAMGQTKNSTLTKQRPQGGLSGNTSSRMVFLK